MIYKALYTDTIKLLSIPESGMGYQIFEANPQGSSYIRKYVAYNSELIIEYDDNFAINKQRIIQKGFSTILNESNYLLLQTQTIKLLSRSIVKGSIYLSEATKNSFGRHSNGKGAKDNPKEYASGTDIFIRLSAYENDLRIDFVKRRLKVGSFTTTLEDYKNCLYKSDDPIDRYALPNNEKIEWAFFILPKSVDELQNGVVQPAFDHEGGGIEAYFEKGTSDNTFHVKTKYGK